LKKIQSLNPGGLGNEGDQGRRDSEFGRGADVWRRQGEHGVRVDEGECKG